ncbi:Arm DNA-binding domain-containing protein [Paenibacillus sp. 1011MAR3C5]|nr:Arm DNA-binding domain-containing protein [Paenibacillus sp. 1011MAR3C5]
MASIKKDDKTGTYYFVLDLPRDPVTGKRKQARRRGIQEQERGSDGG